MRTIGMLTLTTVLLARSSSGETVNFDQAAPGKLPAGWSSAITGTGEPKWTVERDGSAPSQPHVLKQSAETPRPSYPLCVRDGSNLQDGFVEVKFKSVSGKIDQAAGVVWRYQDKDNYYICRPNALEDNVVLYKVEKGKRSELDIVGRQGGYGVKEPVAKAQWHTLRVNFAGNTFTAVFNGRKLFDVQDETFKASGKVGLWTKADSVMLFDDFSFGAK